LNSVLVGLPTQVFPNLKHVFLAIFYNSKLFFWLLSTTRNPGFFNYQTQVFYNTWNYCCIQISVQ